MKKSLGTKPREGLEMRGYLLTWQTLSYSDKADLLHMYYAQILIYILTVSMSMAEVAFKLTYLCIDVAI